MNERKEVFLIILGFILGAPLVIGLILGGVTLLEPLAEMAGGWIPFIVIVVLGVMVLGWLSTLGEKPADISRLGTRSSSYLGSQYPSNWDEISSQARNRDGNECGNCGSSYNLHVHHIVPLSKGGSNNLSNLRTLCSSCHGKLHPHMR